MAPPIVSTINELKTTLSGANITNNRIVLLFGASWCPMTVDFFAPLNEFLIERPASVVYVSSDFDNEQITQSLAALDPHVVAHVKNHSEAAFALKEKYRAWGGRENDDMANYTDTKREHGLPTIVTATSPMNGDSSDFGFDSLEVLEVSDYSKDYQAHWKTVMLDKAFTD